MQGEQTLADDGRQNELQRENRLFLRFCIASLVIHVGVLCIERSHFLPPMAAGEWVIETEFISNGPTAPMDAIANLKPAEEILVDRNVLPQLPRNFAIKSDDPEAPPEPEPVPKEDEKPVAEEPKAETPPPKSASEAPEVERRLAELTKEQAMVRLLKEKARQKEKFADENSSPALSESLTKRSQELASRVQMGSMTGAGDERYAKALKGWIAKRYSLPEIYNLKGSGVRAVVSLVLNQQGDIVQINLAESSSDDLFDKLALKTLREAAPFPRPPSHWVGKAINFPFEVSKQ